VSAQTAVRPVRILVAKVGLDGHDRGVKVVARALRDAGYEVIYTGLRQTPEMVVDAALQEDAQVIGLSIHSGAHMTLFPAVVQELKRRKATDIVVFGGGIIPEDDIAALKKKGVAELFTPGTPLQDIVDWLRKRFPQGGSCAARRLAFGQYCSTTELATLSCQPCLRASKATQIHPM
jgi:methylmalonyl-CoA mutase, C-terminal domain